MSNIVIKAENISKLYRLGQIGTGTVSRDIERWWYRIRGKEDPFLKLGETNDRSKKGASEFVWSLKDINFNIERGEAVGIIGRNGAGKSTLLKIISRVTAPTTGSVKVKGRLASLLEVGTGFHPELTGRENIFLNGAILGMRKHEIQKHFDEIVDFSGVERYIDTPVKRYSSGMYVRLAFAVAAHLEAEILIVDEVLAVGDAEFQKKCLGKMGEVTRNEGRTILFVSHNMTAIRDLCQSAIVLQNGNIAYSGKQHEAILFYQKGHNTNSCFEHHGDKDEAPGNANIRVLRFEVAPLQGSEFKISSGISFELDFYNEKAGINLDVTFELENADHVVLFHHGVLVSVNKDAVSGVYTVKGSLPPHLLNAGQYSFSLIFGESQRYFLFGMKYVIGFEVQNESLGNNLNILPGVIRPDIQYEVSVKERGV